VFRLSSYRRPWRRLVASLAAAALLGTGCSGPSDGAGNAAGQPPASSTPRSDTQPTPTDTAPTLAMPPAPQGLRRFYEQRVSWQPCAQGFECATVTAPLDYADPDGMTISLRVSRRPADEPRERIGAMLVNPGGPGVPGIPYAPSAVAQFRSDVLARYDIVGFDPRGVGTSDAVDCLTDAELDDFIGLDPTPNDAQAVVAAKRAITELGRGCVQGSGNLAAHVSTTEAARDMDLIRAVVDSPRMHYYGGSYGTLLGATYADLFPERVGNMVLDGAIDPTLSPTEQAVQQAEGFQTALDAYLESCVQAGDCPLGDTVPEAEQGLIRLLEQIDANPLPGSDGRTLTVGRAELGVWLPLYVPELWSTLTLALRAAQEGQGAPLLRLSDFYVSRGPNGYQDNSMEALYAINCLDRPVSLSTQQVRQLLPRFERVSPVFGAVFAWGLLGCPDWPVRTSEPIPRIDAPGAAPIVVVGTTGDPATPYESAVALADQLESGVLVTRVGEGHTGFGRGNRCVDDAINDFYAEHVVPDDGLRCG
jgi:pimeloyl-ACP methyl ester carboxylesterase